MRDMEQEEEKLERLPEFVHPFYFVRENDTERLDGDGGPEHPDYITSSSRVVEEPQESAYEEQEGDNISVVSRDLAGSVEDGQFRDILVRSYEIAPGTEWPQEDNEMKETVRNAVRKTYRLLKRRYAGRDPEEEIEDYSKFIAMREEGRENLMNYGFDEKTGGMPAFKLQVLTAEDYTSRKGHFFGESYDLTNQAGSLFEETSSSETAFEEFFQDLIENTPLEDLEELIRAEEGQYITDTVREGKIISPTDEDQNFRNWAKDTGTKRIPRWNELGIILY